MTNDFNRPDLQSVPTHEPSSRRMWGIVAAVIVVLALAWSFWPRTGVTPPAASDITSSTTNAPATTTAPATPAPATNTPAPEAPAPAQ